jgi:protein-disulfide isomerase
VLLFVPASFSGELVAQLARYQAKAPDFAEQGAVLLGISDASADSIKWLCEEKELLFPLLQDTDPPGATGQRYGAVSERQQSLPAVFILDEESLIRRVYEPGKYPDLPNPAMVLRALKKLTGPKPTPVVPDDWQLGPADAPVTVIEYADYECKPCGEAYRLLKQILPDYAAQVLWVHRHLPLRHSHPLAQQAAEAAEAAGAQGKFWEMHHRLFEARGALEREQLIEYAREIGLDVDRFTADLDSRRFQEAVNADFKLAVKNKIKLPPVLFINRLPLDGPRTEANIRAKIEDLLACVAK